MKIREINWKRARAGIMLVVILILSCLVLWDISVHAETTKIGTIVGIDSDSTLNFRSGPGTSYSIIGSLKNGQSGEVLDQSYDTGGTLWYKMYVSGMTGWASSAYVSVSEYTLTTDEEFDAYLTAQGFPDSYKAQLQALHKLYPNWKFEAQITNLSWSDVIAAESTLGKNLVSKSSITSWKSTQDGAYNWETGEWVEFDSGGWVMASQEMIEYCMDPRNFLDSVNIFQFIKQSYSVDALTDTQLAQKKADLTNMVKNTYLAGTCDGRSYVDVIMDVAASTGVDPFTLASMMIQEQGTNGTGSSISGTVSGYEGYYNYFNIGAYKTSTMTAVQRGLWYASGAGTGATTYGRPWNTRTKSITGGALYYGTNYVNVGQDTLYLKKFNVQGSNKYGHQYMTNVQGAISEGQHVAAGYDEDARSAALTFKIPVYKDMPQTACTKPTGNGNPNYMLKSLAVAGQSLTPTFSMYETSYSVIVPYSTASVTISAEAYVTTTSIAGTGTKNLSVGNNDFEVITTAQDGGTRTYGIRIVREEAPSTGNTGSTGGVKTPTITLNTYSLNSDQTITGITEASSGTVSVTNFVKNISVTDGSYKITTASGSEKTSGNVGTGDQVRVYDSSVTLKYSYSVIIYGDTNGDGVINAKDLLVIQKNNIQAQLLSGVYLVSADVNRDGKVNAKDLLAVQKHNIKAGTIQQ